MNVCERCGAPIDPAGFTNCGGQNEDYELCKRDRTKFEAEVEESRKALDLQVLALMEKNEMPECFEPTRAATVAMARLLMQALRQNQELTDALQQMHTVAVLH